MTGDLVLVAEPTMVLNVYSRNQEGFTECRCLLSLDCTSARREPDISVKD